MRRNSALLPGSGFDVQALLAPQQALTLYFTHAGLRATGIEFTSLEDAFGCVLAQHVVADLDYPAMARSAMDGFAVRSAQTPGRLHVAGEIRMGAVWPRALAGHEAVRIPTGGVVPSEADAVVPIEDVKQEQGEIVVSHRVDAGHSVTPAGSDMRAGERVLEAGRRIGGAELGVLATLGITSIPVHRRPVVAVISSGDELVDASATPGPAQVRDSNRWALAGALRGLGASVRHLPIVTDDAQRLEALLREAIATADAVFLSGGSSVGERDLTPRIVDGLGEPGVIVHGLRVKPGKPTVLASVGGKPVIGLPGNPASALMILEAIAAPIVCALLGTVHRPATMQARLARPYRKRGGWTWFVPVKLEEHRDGLRADPLEMRSSMTSLLTRASGFVTLDETVETLAQGEPVRVMRFISSVT